MTIDNAALERVSAAKLWLTSPDGGGAPYLSAALYSAPTILTSEVRRISADDHWRVYVNPGWAAAVDVPELGSHLGHLLWHLLRDHARRARSMAVGSRESTAWSTAADLTVSQTLHAAGHPLVGLSHPDDSQLPRDRAVEEYYAMLSRLGRPSPIGTDLDGDQDMERPPCGSAADGLPRGYEPSSHEGGGIDETRGWDLRRQTAIAFSTHMQNRGSKPGEWTRWVADVLEPKIAWQQVLSAAVRRAVGWAHGNTEATYRRLSRRRAASTHVILPGSQRPVPCVAIVVDTSASMDDGLLAQALGEVDGVVRSFGGGVRGVQVYSCDAAVGAVTQATRGRNVELIGGGGTDLRVGIAAAVSGRPRPEILVVLTDGETPWPVSPPRGCAVVAVILTRTGVAPPCPSWTEEVVCTVS